MSLLSSSFSFSSKPAPAASLHHSMMLHRAWVQDGTAQFAIAPESPEKRKTSKACSCSHGIPIFWFYILVFNFQKPSNSAFEAETSQESDISLAWVLVKLWNTTSVCLCWGYSPVLHRTKGITESICKAAQPARLLWIKERTFCLGAEKASWWLFTASFSLAHMTV